jgi:hypothetical protein
MEYIQSTEPRKVHGLVVASYGCEWVKRDALQLLGRCSGPLVGPACEAPDSLAALPTAAWFDRKKPESLRVGCGCVQMMILPWAARWSTSTSRWARGWRGAVGWQQLVAGAAL